MPVAGPDTERSARRGAGAVRCALLATLAAWPVGAGGVRGSAAGGTRAVAGAVVASVRQVVAARGRHNGGLRRPARPGHGDVPPNPVRRLANRRPGQRPDREVAFIRAGLATRLP